jgi:hypothetical protein
MVALSASEMALCAAEAAREGLAVGAWLGEVGVHRAGSSALPEDLVHSRGPVMQALMVTRVELMENRRVRNVGGNLNDVARYANRTAGCRSTRCTCWLSSSARSSGSTSPWAP